MPKQGAGVLLFEPAFNGPDGTSIIAANLIDILKRLGLEPHLRVGRVCWEYGNFEPDFSIKELPELSLAHPVAAELQRQTYSNWYSKKELWDDKYYELRYKSAKHQVRSLLEQELEEAKAQGIQAIMFHNFATLFYPPWISEAVIELMQEHNELGFVSYSADAIHERPTRLGAYRKIVQERIWRLLSSRTLPENTSKLKKQDIPGPINLENLVHIILCQAQLKEYVKRGVPHQRLHLIPDFIKVPERFKPRDRGVSGEFLYLLQKHLVVQPQTELKPDDLYILANVRPIRRKGLLELVMSASILKDFGYKPRIIFTHPNRYDGSMYFSKEVLPLANRLGIPVIYLGENLKMQPCNPKQGFYYPALLKQLSTLQNVIAIVSSFNGGFENAVLEAAKYGIPLSVNSMLQSFPDIYNGFDGNIVEFPGATFAALVRGEQVNVAPLQEFAGGIRSALNNEAIPLLYHQQLKANYSLEAVLPRWENVFTSTGLR